MLNDLMHVQHIKNSPKNIIMLFMAILMSNNMWKKINNNTHELLKETPLRTFWLDSIMYAVLPKALVVTEE